MCTYELLNPQMVAGATGAPLQAVPAPPIPLLEARPEPGPAPILHHRMEALAVSQAVVPQ
jgi:hypothetical protein